jgi:hypothetical protein
MTCLDCFIEAIFRSNLQGCTIWRTLLSSSGYMEGANTCVSSVSPFVLKTCVCVLNLCTCSEYGGACIFCSVESCVSAGHEGV